MSDILEAMGLCKRYGAFALDSVSFSLPAGCIMGFVGPNGSGKTTAIKLILGAIRGDAGRVRLFGEERSEAHNERIGAVLDAPAYVDDWTAADVEAAVSPFYRNWDRAAFASFLDRFGIGRKKKVKELSRGMGTKLQIAAALSHGAELLVLDEPTSGLDPVARDEICDLLRDFVADGRRGALFSTHITQDLEKVADYIAFILNGSIVFAGTKDALLEKYARVAGGRQDLAGGQRSLVIGYREFGTGFEGMVAASDVGRLPRGVLVEQISLDEIIVFMNKGADLNGQA
jgi:ABC-2 type transport system ATP-binding protein